MKNTHTRKTLALALSVALLSATLSTSVGATAAGRAPPHAKMTWYELLISKFNPQKTDEL
jgi:hypothetical protein